MAVLLAQAGNHKAAARVAAAFLFALLPMAPMMVTPRVVPEAMSWAPV